MKEQKLISNKEILNENFEAAQSYRSQDAYTDRALLPENQKEDEQSSLIKNNEEFKPMNLPKLRTSDLQNAIIEQSPKSNINLQEKKKQSFPGSFHIKHNRSESLALANIPIFSVLQAQLKKNKILNEGKNNDSDRLRQLNEDLETDRGVEWRNYKDAQTQEQRNAILNQHLQQKTNFGEFLNPADLFFKDSFPPLKAQLYPRSALNKSDMKKRLFFNDLIDKKINAICDWKQNDEKGKKKKSYIKSVIKENDNILVITEKDAKEILDTYEDTWPCLNIRKSIWRIVVIIRDVTAAFISTKIFENGCILVIVLNCFAMMTDDPTALVRPPFFDLLDNIFLAAYTFEMVSKIIGLGFLIGENAYLKDPWNMLDLFIVGSAYVTLFSDSPGADDSKNIEVGDIEVSSSFDLKALRVFRVLRPLKTISNIQGLKILVQALFAAIPLLRDTIFILFCYFIVFAITGVQMLSGMLKNRCINQQTGNNHPSNMICGQSICPQGYFCGKTNLNPHFGLLNFDNVMYSLMAVFQSVTLQGWSEQEVDILRAYSDFMILYFVPLVYIGSFFFLNLTLAVINSKFTESHNQQKSEKIESQKILLNPDDQVEQQFVRNLKDEINILQNFHIRKIAAQMVRFLRIKQAEKNKSFQQKISIIQENKEEIKSILGAQKQENKQGEKEPKTVAFQDEAEQIETNDLQPKRIMTSAQQLDEVEEKEEEYQSDQEKKDKDQNKEPSLNENLQIQKEENKNQQQIKRLKTLKLTNHKINQMKTQAIYNIQMIQPKHNLKNNLNYENQDLKMNLKMKGNEGFARQILAKKKFQEDEKKQIKIQTLENTLDKNINIANLLPQSILTDDFVNNELNFDKIIPINFRPPKQEINLTDKEQEDIQILDDRIQNKQKDDKLLNFSDIDEGSILILKGTDYDIQEKSFQVSENKNSEAISNSIKSIGNNRTIKSQFPNEKLQIITPRSALISATQVKDNIRDKFVNTAFFQNDQDNESDASILQSFRQTQDNSKEVSQATQSQFQNQKMKVFDDKIKKRMSIFIKNTSSVTSCPQNISKTFRNIIQTQVSLSKRSYDNFHKIIIDEEESEQPQVDLLFKDQDEEEVNYHIENKVKAKKNQFKNKSKNVDKIDAQFSFCFDLKKKTKNGEDIVIKKLEEKILNDKPEDVFALMDKQIQKCMIMPQIDYKSFSQQDLTEERITASQVLSEFVQHQQEPQPLSYGVFEPELQKKSNNYLPFQQKVIYDALEDSSELEDYVTSSEEEYWRQLKQPYQTLQNVAYFEQLKQLPLKEITRRSDIVATSTFSSSVFPMDKRKISNVYRVLLDNNKIVQFQDEHNIFKALCQEQKNQDKIMRDKDKIYNDNYIRSFIYKNEFSSETLKEFKQICEKLNCNKKEMVYKSQQELFDIQIRFQQNLRASEKRGVPRMNYEIAQQIVNGQYHDQDEETEQNIEKQGKMSEFQKEMDALSGNQNNNKQESEIPKELRLEFDIPENMEDLQINFNAIKRVDFDRKKNKHVWSGQDVMPERLNYSLSQFIVENINSIRAWPRGFQGIIKRGRVIMRLIIFSNPFDAFFTFLVCVNTVVLSLNFHGISQEMNQVLSYINDQLTKLFIVELAFKLIGLGPVKYVADRMHILDATIVSISIFEMIYSAILPGGANFKAFSTLRMLRTFRVIRLVRLLKGMQGMQVIIAVIGRSYKSTIYISILLLVFIFIFSLLGMQFFGGKLNYQEGLPQNNFDNFKNAGIAVFCVLTMETWPDIFFDTARGDLNKYMVALFFVAWIFIGNFIILNLFISVLLDSYLEENDEEEDKLSKEKALEVKLQRKLEKKKHRQRKIVLMIKNRKVQTKVKEEDEAEEIEDLDEEEIVKIFKNQGFMKKDLIEEQKVELFIGVECQSSFFLFKQENPFRIICYKMVHHKFWDRWVMALIFLSSIKLALDTYLPSEETSLFVVASFYIDYFLNFSFIGEMITKQIAIGFIMDNGSYLSESWNCLDFFIVMSSIADMSLSFLNIKFVKILRLLRTLRPLRVITHNVALRMIVVALLDSVANIFNVLLIVLVVWLMFGIMGVNFFGGKFSYCSIDMYKLLTKFECETAGGEWETYNQNFDNVFQAVSSLFIVSTLEGWVQVMFQALDSYDVDYGPQKNASTIYALYFIGFVIVGSFFFLNFFIGVLFLRYNQAQKQELEGFSKKDIAWLDIQKLILESEPEYETINVPESPFRQKFHSLVCDPRFENTIMAVICINMLSMAIQMENQSALQTFIIGNSNYAFTAIFIIEGFLKFVAFGFSYFENGWNRFDFFVICAGILDILIQFLGSAIQWLSFAPQVSRIFRIIRLTRIVKLFGKAQGLQALVQTMIFSVSSFINVVMLLTLVYFMFAILGVFLFSEVTQGEIINEYKNFSAFWPSLFTLLAVSTGENWNLLLYDLNKTPPNCIERVTCGTSFSLPYFFSLIILLQWVMFNLFILIVIEQFEKYYLPKENIIKIFKNDYVIFMDVWKQFTMQRYKCLKIKENQLIGFFHRLGDKDDSESSLGFSRLVYDEGDVKKFLLKMSIRSTDGFICFNELLYRAMRRKYGNFKIGKKMQVSEYQTQFSIYHKMAEQSKQLEIMLQNDEIQKNLIKKENGINPFLTSMSYRLSFRTWFKVAKSRLKKKAVTLLEKCGNIDMLDKDKLADPPQKFTAVDICQEDYFSFTSEDENFTEMSLGKSLISINKKQEFKTSHLEKFEKAMIFRIKNSIPKDSPFYPFIKKKLQQNTD